MAGIQSESADACETGRAAASHSNSNRSSRRLVLNLRFGETVPPLIRPRVLYAFRVFAAIYGHKVSEGPGREVKCVFYGGPADLDTRTCALYVPSLAEAAIHEPRKRPLRHAYAGEAFWLFYGLDPSTGRPDWLGEIFEWLSCAYERSTALRDPVGRIPYSESVFGRTGISPRKPYAAMLMAWLENELQTGGGVEALPRASPAVSGAAHVVVCSHDIDFYYSSWGPTLVRLAKNLAIAARLYRSPSFLLANLRLMIELLRGKRVADYLDALIEAGEKLDFRSTIFIVVRHKHRRDPRYSVGRLESRLSKAEGAGCEVGLHGSYESIIEREDLRSEVLEYERCRGRRPAGSRQHWLRFDHPERLFGTVERAGLRFDSSVGFHERVGFRSGASFAFPPYNFVAERPHNFLEIPLVVMDGSLEATCRATREDPSATAAEILQESRKWGWGGVGILWHNPLEPIQVPPEINEAFWECLKSRAQFEEVWTSASKFLASCLSRYHDAGLLTSIEIDG